jgi:hypothetical protein
MSQPPDHTEEARYPHEHDSYRLPERDFPPVVPSGRPDPDAIYGTPHPPRDRWAWAHRLAAAWHAATGWLGDHRPTRHHHHYEIIGCVPHKPSGYTAMLGTKPSTVVVMMCWCHRKDQVTSVILPGEVPLSMLTDGKAALGIIPLGLTPSTVILDEDTGTRWTAGPRPDRDAAG